MAPGQEVAQPVVGPWLPPVRWSDQPAPSGRLRQRPISCREEQNQVTSSRPSARNAPTWVTLLLGLLGLFLIVVAIVYFAEPAHKLPSFFPGHTPHGTRACTKHGIAAAV